VPVNIIILNKFRGGRNQQDSNKLYTNSERIIINSRNQLHLLRTRRVRFYYIPTTYLFIHSLNSYGRNGQVQDASDW